MYLMMNGQLQNLMAQQREMAAQMLAQLGQRERDREREMRRDRDRRRDDDRDSDRRAGRERDRSRDRDRDRRSYDDERGRSSRYDRDKLHDYDHGRSRDDGHDYDDNSYSRDGESREDRSSDKWMTDTPTNTILLRGLPPNVDEQDIKAELMMFGAPVKDVRLMKRKDTGASRGFAFVEFQNVADSQRWMEQNQGQVTILNQYSISMFYSTPKTGNVDSRPPGDWTCSKCGVHNFKRRDHCFKCNISKEESDGLKEGDGYDQVGHNLCNTLIFRGLDALTTEENIITTIHKIAQVMVKNMRVIRDETTQTSKGYAFAEMNSIQDSGKLMESISKLQGPFEVDGKAVIVNYSKNTFSTVMVTMNQQWAQGQYDYSAHQHGYDSSYYAQGYYDSAGTYHYYDYSQYYGQDYQGAESSSTQSDVTNAAAAVAQAAIQQAQAAKAVMKKQEEMQKKLVAQMQTQQKLAQMTPEERMKHQAQQWAQQQEEPQKSSSKKGTPTSPGSSTGGAAQSDNSTDYHYPEPDVSTYQYDETSGYYYDPSTGLYYDASSQYYYNAQTGQFLYWDGEKKTYLPAPDDAMGQGDDDKADGSEHVPKDKKEKVKVAKKIAKDMEKWAKALNSQKEAMKDGFKRMLPLGPQEDKVKKEAAAADAGFAIMAKAKTPPFAKPDTMPAFGGRGRGGAAETAGAPGLVPAYGEGEESEEEAEAALDGEDGNDDEQFSDWSKMACLLCKRQFPSRDGLVRHNQLSDLHKKNIDDQHKANAAKMNSQGRLTAAGQQQYRDRAKERRQKYGAPAPPEPRKSKVKPPVVYEQPTKQGIGSDNIGNKLMQKMGWNAGEGLGRGKHGIKDPVTANRRTAGAGLGATGSNVDLDPNDTYKDAVKKTMYARFHDMG